MAQVFPTKANLMATQKSLDLAKLGYELMDRKRNILVREMMQLISEAKGSRGKYKRGIRQGLFVLEACQYYAWRLR